MATGIKIKNDVFFKKVKIAVLLAVSATIPTKWVNLNSYFIIILTLLWLVEVFIYKAKINFNFKILFIFVSFFFLTLISTLYSSNLVPLISKAETRLAMLALPLILLGVGDVDEKVLKLILKAFVISCTIISLICIVSTFYSNFTHGNMYQTTNNWLYSSDNLIKEFGFHPNYFSIYCAFSVFILFFLVKEKELQKWISLILIPYFCIVQLLLASRVGIISFIILFILTVIYEGYLNKRLLLGILISFGFFLIIVLLGLSSQTVKDKFDALFNRNIHKYNEPFRVNKRGIQWNSATQVFLKSPLIGVGTGDMQDELQKVYLEKRFKEGYEYQYNPHNLFLDSAASLGLLGVLSNLLLFGISFYISFLKRNILYLQFLILFLLISLVESTFSVQKGVVFFFFFNTIFFSYLTNSRRNQPQ